MKYNYKSLSFFLRKERKVQPYVVNVSFKTSSVRSSVVSVSIHVALYTCTKLGPAVIS